MKKLVLRICSLFVLSTSLVFSSVEAAQLPDFSDLIEKASPAVVKITAVTKAREARQFRPGPNDQLEDVPEIFRQLLEQHQAPQRDRGSLGSGFIISSDGYVITNNHVVSEADEIKVILNDDREFEAKFIGTDERTDIALLKIDAKNLPQLNLAKNEKLKVGQWVVAIGSPFGLDYSASAGIVSAIGRNIENSYVQFIQTDLAINPGNSGGPLFNMDGEVVGINSQIYTPSGGSVGLSFAIPSSVAIDVVSQLKEKGRVERGWLGVVIGNVDKDLASAYGLDKAQGAIVSEVVPKGPAEKAGVKVGDLIVKFNGQDVHGQGDLPRIVGQLAPGTKVTFDVIRKGKRETLSGTLEQLKDESGALPAAGPKNESKTTKPDALGLTVAPTDARDKERGVQIVSVEPDSAAQKAGLQRGDIITQLDFVDLDSVATYSKVVGGLPKNTAKAIRFVRNGTPVFRSITIK